MYRHFSTPPIQLEQVNHYWSELKALLVWGTNDYWFTPQTTTALSSNDYYFDRKRLLLSHSPLIASLDILSKSTLHPPI